MFSKKATKVILAVALILLFLIGLNVYVTGTLSFHPDEAEDRIAQDKIFASVAEADTQTVEGVVVKVGFYVLEPGFWTLTVQKEDGTEAEIIMNQNTQVLMPGKTKPIAATGYVGEGEHPDDFENLHLEGRYAPVEVGTYFRKTEANILLRGTFTRP